MLTIRLNIVIASVRRNCAYFDSTNSRTRPSGILHGVVKDAAGAPVAGAFVKLNNSERRLTFMVISQAQGRYSVNNLPNGNTPCRRSAENSKRTLRADQPADTNQRT